MDIDHVWSRATSQLQSGLELKTWSINRGFGPVFVVKRVSASEIVVAPKATGDERTLVKGSFDKVLTYLRNPNSALRKKTFNTSYCLGVLKHLELIR